MQILLDWFLNRKKDYKVGRFLQVVLNALHMKLRYDLEWLKKIKNHQGEGWMNLPSYVQYLGGLESDQIGPGQVKSGFGS